MLVWCRDTRRALGAVALVAALAASGSVRADDLQAWVTGAVNGPLAPGSRVLAWLDAQARFRDDASELDVAAVRPALGWRFGPGVDAYAGYAYVVQKRSGPDVVEHRAWEQVGYPLGSWLDGRLTGRTRVEQRMRRGAADTGWRVRQTLRYARPFAAQPRLALVLWDEAFVTLDDTDWGQRRGFDQNRAFLGAAWQGAWHLRVEAGYLEQRVHGHGRARDRTTDVLSLSIAMAL